MKPYFQNYDLNNFLSDLGNGLAMLLSNKTVLVISFATSGILRVLTHNSTATIDFAFITFVAFGISTMLGLCMHMVSGELNAKIFLIKTGTQLTVMVSLIVLGYLVAIAIFGLRQYASELGIFDAPAKPVVGMYFIFSSYMISFTYHFLKSLDLIEQLIPNYVPRWFSAIFRQWRKTGDFADLLKTPTIKPEDTNPPA